MKDKEKNNVPESIPSQIKDLYSTPKGLAL
jgi:hypothetical protein